MNSSLSPNEVVYHRRLIYSSFKGMMGDEQAREAVGLWEKYFSNSRVFSPVRFLRVCKEVLNIPNELVKVLIQRLTENMNLPPETLGPDPFANGGSPSFQTQVGGASPRSHQAVRGQSRRTVPDLGRGGAQAAKPPMQVVFEFVLSSLLNTVWRDRSDLLQYLGQSDLSHASKQMLQIWCGATTPYLVIPNLEFEEMARVLDYIYSWYCDMFGPGTTDQSFARVIAQAETIPEATFFSPRQFL